MSVKKNRISGKAGPPAPLYATSDGGVVVTTTQNGQLGTLYTLDQNGNITLQSADTGIAHSWLGQSYYDPAGTISSISLPLIQLAPTFAAVTGGNRSGNGTAIQQVQTNKPQFGDEQLPPPGASLRTNYNSIELITTASPDTIFSQFIQTFVGVQSPNNDVVGVEIDGGVSTSLVRTG